MRRSSTNPKTTAMGAGAKPQKLSAPRLAAVYARPDGRLLYHSISEGVAGASVGKLIFGYRVV